MANLDLIKKLNQEYGKNSPITEKTKTFSFNESFDPDNIEKALSNSLAEMGPSFTTYFDLGLPAEVAILFIDVCNFSTRMADLDGEGIAEFFDDYYDQIIPIIYKHGGEIDKIIGDGIICVFGRPFLNGDLNTLISAADSCAKEIILLTRGTIYSSKIAFHCGKINYFKNKTGHYNEFTMVGKPLTELFRLESVSFDERVNYYGGTAIHHVYNERITRFNTSGLSKATWNHLPHPLPSLKGINFTTYYSIQHT